VVKQLKTLADVRGDMPLTTVADMVGISKSYLSLLENGKRRMSLDMAEKLGNIYGVSVDVILHAYKVCRLSTNRTQLNVDGVILDKPTGTEGR